MRASRLALPLMLLALLASASQAHFQVLLPSADMFAEPGEATFRILFTHPMEDGPVMNMGQPVQFGVIANGKKTDLRASLVKGAVKDAAVYSAKIPLRQPGDHVFFIEPAPYWEPAESKMIVHCAKVVVNGMEKEEGWDAMVGFPIEIEPLVRPYGLWTGNVFRGVVKKDGKPLPFAEVEVEYLNEGRKVAIPAGPFTTQVIRADANGVFAYAMPRAGWWGFAALVEGDQKMKSPKGDMVPVELGGLMWVRVQDMTAK